MGYLVIAVLIVAAFLIGRPGHSKPKSSPSKRRPTAPRTKKTTTAKTQPADKMAPLYERWKAIDNGQIEVPEWFHDEPTHRQLDRIESDGIALPASPLTKGKASDLIGTTEPPDEDDLKCLRFFKVRAEDVDNQTLARIRIESLFADAQNKAKWESRPATALQKDFYRFVNEPAPNKLTAMAAEVFMQNYELTDQQTDDWDAYEYLLDELSDKDNCELYDIKKPARSVLRQAITDIGNTGVRLAEIKPEDIAKRIAQIKPDLKL
ncbi:MAG: hypothetical protein R3180_00130 [Marinobacter sp.]|nr:hypothetical protein [Marinobacter sp.]